MRSWMRWMALVGLVAASACGGGGGDRDPTIVSGNVLSVAPSASARTAPRGLWRIVASFLNPLAVAQVPGVTIAIAGTNRSTETDEDGLFRLEVGQFGTHTLLFAGDGASAGLTVVLPFGGSYELIDVEIDGNEISVAEQRVSFRGPITAIDCQQRLLVVLSGERVSYRVRLGTGTLIRDEDGNSVACGELALGREAEVFSIVENLDTVLATEIQLNPGQVAPTPTPTPTPTGEEEEATPTPTATPD